MRIETE